MKKLVFILPFVLCFGIVTGQNSNSTDSAHSVLPADGVVDYVPKDTNYRQEAIPLSKSVSFTPLAYFYFRPEVTYNYKEAGMPLDTNHFNFYLRGDFGARISLPKNIDMVFNLQSNGTYTIALGPLDKNMTLYEAYVDLKAGRRRSSLRFGRMDIGKYGTEMLVGNDDFGKGRSFESVRYRHKGNRRTTDLMWVQMYTSTLDSGVVVWRHPVFAAAFNTFNFSERFNLDVNAPFLIDQIIGRYRTFQWMPDARIFGSFSSWKYSGEIAHQGGPIIGLYDKNDDGKVNTYATEWSAGYFAKENKFFVDLSYYWASGDPEPDDNKLHSFNVLWQNEHRRFGYIDAFKGSNVQAVTLHADYKIAPLVNLGVHGVYANVNELKDKSAAVTSLAVVDLSNTDKTIGAGGDLYINYFVSHNLNIQFAAACFNPGKYLTSVSGIDRPMIRLYLMGILKI